jgi:hypothetical protein
MGELAGSGSSAYTAGAPDVGDFGEVQGCGPYLVALERVLVAARLGGAQAFVCGGALKTYGLWGERDLSDQPCDIDPRPFQRADAGKADEGWKYERRAVTIYFGRTMTG